MNGSERDPLDPPVWLDDAEEDLRAAQLFQERSDFAPRHACWYALQSAEESLKGLTVLDQRTHQRTHNLWDLLPESADLSVSGADLDHLTAVGVAGRYPDAGSPPTLEDARRAVGLAGTIYDLVAAEFERRGAIN
ncbi:MAG: HEPN domain-containing protein [Bryobacterales bacterium]|nr:HEPN domain-containing protein [Bryobacterales bacterium]